MLKLDARAVARALLAKTRLESRDAHASVGTAVVEVWNKLEQLFGQLVGEAAIRTLMERSIGLATIRRPWLVSAEARPGPASGTWKLLCVAVDRQPLAEACDGFDALFATLLALLARLIGENVVRLRLEARWPDLIVTST